MSELFGRYGIEMEEVDDSVPEKTDKKRRFSVVSLILAALLILATIAGSIVLAMTKILPPGTLALALVGAAVVTITLVVSLVTSGPGFHKVRFWISAVLAVALIIAHLGIVKVGTDYLSVGQDIQPPPNDTVLYDIVVLGDGPDKVADLAGTKMGQVEAEPLSGAVQEEVGELVDVEFVPRLSWSAMMDSLEAREVDSIVIQDGYLQILEEADPELHTTLKVLASFEVDSSRTGLPIATPSPTPTPPPKTDSYVVYISGIDTAGSVSTRSRSDVNILMVVNPTTGKVLLVNTPRDYYVPLRDRPGLPDKLTHAGIYGVDVSMGTLEDLYGISINYYLRINFTSVVTIVNALGGVDVESAYDFTAGGYHFTVGTNHLDGAAALAFSRERYSFTGGDRTRGENQQRVIEAIIKKLSSPAILSGYGQIMGAIQGSIETSMPPEVISAQVQQQLSSGESWDVTSISVDGTGAMDYTYSMPGQLLYVMVPDQAIVDNASGQIKATLEG